MEGRSSKVYQSWLCCGVPVGSPARAFFMKKVQPTVDAIDAHIEILKNEVADLEARREHLHSGVASPSHFGDQTLISGL